MAVVLLAHLGIVVALFAVGYLLERRVMATEPLLSVPPLVGAIVGGLALMLPYLLLWKGLLTVPIVDEVVLALALSLALWLLAGRVVGIGTGTGSC